MAYRYDIFLSYMHDDPMDSWVHQHLRPFLESFVGNAINRRVEIFIDRNGIATGDSWPLRLKQALARSRSLVAVWSPLYFHSAWCRKECAVMLHREAQLGYRSINKPNGLLVPVNVFDGKFFPQRARNIQHLDCRKFWVVGDGFCKTERYVEFQDHLRGWSSDVAQCISDAPPWHESWLNSDWLDVSDDDLKPPPQSNFAFPGLEG